MLNDPNTKGAVERVARIIDPVAWDGHDHYVKTAEPWERIEPEGRLAIQFRAQANDLAAPSLAKAEAILADLGELVTALEEIDCWALVIESAMRHYAPRDHPAVLAALKANATALARFRGASS